jgi:hypothetical protein
LESRDHRLSGRAAAGAKMSLHDKPGAQGQSPGGVLLYSVPRRRNCRASMANDLFRFPAASRRDPGVEAWFSKPGNELRRFARPWFEQMRGCGADVRELLNDGHPIACVEDAAFGYVNAFSAHVNVGFFHGSALADPAGLLEGTGKRMRHVKLRWGQQADAAAVSALITAAYKDMRRRLAQTG